jgi:hypothetical protein
MEKNGGTPKTAVATRAPDARFGVWGEPAVVLAYAPSGAGKTTDMLYSFPTALFLAQKGALKPAIGTVGLSHVWETEIRTLDDAISLAAEIGKLPWDKRPTALVVDDLSLLADNTLVALEHRSTGSKNKYAMWGELQNKVKDLAGVARWEAGIHVALNGHEQAPFTDEGGCYWRGGPRLPSKKLTAIIPHTADTVLRGRLGQRPGSPHQGVYDCFLDASWVMKDRHGIRGENLPMNVGELLRNRGYTLPRAPGLEWQEEWVELIAQSLAAGKVLDAVKKAAIDRLRAKGIHDLHIRWVIRDGIDRHAFRLAQANLLVF